MTKAKRPNSVRARGARKLTQATVGMVVVGVGGVAGLAIHDAAAQPGSTTSVSQTTSAQSATDGSSGTTSDTTSSSDSSSSSTVTATQSTPQATSGGS
jgi:cytoskeletal protein RodZ